MVPVLRSPSLAQIVLAGLLLAGSGGVEAQPALHDGPLPTRMQLCQLELQGSEGEDRRRLLRECLLRRADAERLVVRDCRRQLRETRVAVAERFRQQRDCEYRALAVHSSELPRPSPVMEAPAPAEVEGADTAAVAKPEFPVAHQALESAGPVTAVEVQAAP